MFSRHHQSSKIYIVYKQSFKEILISSDILNFKINRLETCELKYANKANEVLNIYNDSLSFKSVQTNISR